MSDNRTYYKILKVTKDAPEREIKRAYHNLARQFHPDKAKTPEEQEQFEQEFALISKAYNVLKDPGEREAYNAKLKKENETAFEEAGNSTTTRQPSSASQGSAPSSNNNNNKAHEAGRINIAQKAYAKGVQLYQMGEFIRSIEFFEAAIKNNDQEASYHARLAMSLMKAKKSFTRSVEAAKKACELDSYNIDFKMNLAEIYELAGSTSLAIKQWEDVLKWDNNNDKAKMKINILTNGNKKSVLDSIFSRFRK